MSGEKNYQIYLPPPPSKMLKNDTEAKLKKNDPESKLINK